MSRTKALARGYLWWPYLDRDIEDMVERCSACASTRNTPKESPLHPWIWASRPGQRVHIDYAEYKGQSFLVIVDSYSKWLEVIPVKSTTSSNTIEKLRTWFASVGIPEEIVSDNGPQFTSSEFQDFMKHSGVRHTLVPPYHPQSNGYRITPHSTTGTSPAELFLKRQLRTRLSCIKPNLRESVEEKQQKMKEQHDGGQCKVGEFQGGEQVQVKTTIPGQKWKWISGVIHRKLGPLTYLVRVGKRIRYCHVDHLLASSATMLEPELTPLPFDVELPSFKESGMDRALVSPDETGKGTPEMVETREKLADSVNKDTKVPDQTDAVPERRYPLRMRKPTKKLDL
ncbi:uncharacterized protein K02A2.6-like [Saccostrea cucullata]|uniref:uncharacterized protein K02A2.6-like n=1 Tax=Saccostrea cuccullata TaxID=36930 RepID=UPI002ED301C2